MYVLDAWECDALTKKHLNCISSVVLSIKVIILALFHTAIFMQGLIVTALYAIRSTNASTMWMATTYSKLYIFFCAQYLFYPFTFPNISVLCAFNSLIQASSFGCHDCLSFLPIGFFSVIQYLYFLTYISMVLSNTLGAQSSEVLQRHLFYVVHC